MAPWLHRAGVANAALATPDHDRLALRATAALTRAVACFRSEIAVQDSHGWRYWLT